MIWLIGILTTLYISLYIGKSVGVSVDDEIAAGGMYLEILLDGLLLGMTGVFLVAFGWGAYTVLAIVLLAMLRTLTPYTRAYPIVSGSLVAASMFGPHETFLTIAILALMLNYLAAARAQRVARSWIGQPTSGIIAAVAILALI